MSESEEKTRVTAIVQKPATTDGPRGGDCLVVIYTKEPSLLGKRFVLDVSPMRIGRGAENHIVLEGDSVSRRHAHIEQRGNVWWAVDDGSTNGTYVNDEQISREMGLANGDRIKVGPTIFKYLSGQDVEAQGVVPITVHTFSDHARVHLDRGADPSGRVDLWLATEKCAASLTVEAGINLAIIDHRVTLPRPLGTSFARGFAVA